MYIWNTYTQKQTFSDLIAEQNSAPSLGTPCPESYVSIPSDIYTLLWENGEVDKNTEQFIFSQKVFKIRYGKNWQKLLTSPSFWDSGLSNHTGDYGGKWWEHKQISLYSFETLEK